MQAPQLVLQRHAAVLGDPGIFQRHVMGDYGLGGDLLLLLGSCHSLAQCCPDRRVGVQPTRDTLQAPCHQVTVGALKIILQLG